MHYFIVQKRWREMIRAISIRDVDVTVFRPTPTMCAILSSTW